MNTNYNRYRSYNDIMIFKNPYMDYIINDIKNSVRHFRSEEEDLIQYSDWEISVSYPLTVDDDLMKIQAKIDYYFQYELYGGIDTEFYNITGFNSGFFKIMRSGKIKNLLKEWDVE